MTLSLNTHHEEFVVDQVKSGRFRSADDVIKMALTLLEAQSAGGEATSKKDIRQKIRAGIESLDRGEFVTPEQVDEDIKALGAAWRASNA